MKKEIMKETISWNHLRFKTTTVLLREVAEAVGIDISDIPNNTRQKEKLATAIWDRLYGKKGKENHAKM